MRVKRPKSFTLVWPPSSSDGLVAADKTGVEGDGICSIWFPEAPKGYVALGCVVSPGRKEPPISSVFCILATLVSPCGLRDCISIDSSSRYVYHFHTLICFMRINNFESLCIYFSA